MLIEEVDVARVDSAGDLLANLVRTAAFDHVQPGPSILRFGTGRSAHEKIVLHLSGEVVLLDMFGDSGRNLPIKQGASILNFCNILLQWLFPRREESTYLGYPTPVNPDQPI